MSDKSAAGVADFDGKLDVSAVIEHINSVLPTYASLKALQLVYQSAIAQTTNLIREYQTEISDPFLERLENTDKCVQTAFESLAGRMTAGEHDVSNALQVMQLKLNKVDNEVRVIVDKDQVKHDLHAVLETMTTLKRDVEHLSTLTQSTSVLGDLSSIQAKLNSVDALVQSQKSLVASMNSNVSLHTASLTQLHAQINRVSQYFGDYQVPSPFASLSEYLTSFSHVPSTLQSIEVRIGGLSKHCMELVKTIGVSNPMNSTKNVLDTCASTQSNVDIVSSKLSLLEERTVVIEDIVSGSNNINIPSQMSVMKTEMELMKLAMKHYETVIADLKNDIKSLKESPCKCDKPSHTQKNSEVATSYISPRSADPCFEIVSTPRAELGTAAGEPSAAESAGSQPIITTDSASSVSQEFTCASSGADPFVPL
jgi:uncharacterized phage infection (PIP) family protein YhgE